MRSFSVGRRPGGTSLDPGPPRISPKPNASAPVPPGDNSGLPRDLQVRHGAQKCGRTYAKQLEIRNPFEGTDNHELTVAPIITDSRWLGDINRSKGVIATIHNVLVQIPQELERFRGSVPAQSRSYVLAAVAKSRKYLDQAVALDEWWAKSFLPPAGEGKYCDVPSAPKGRRPGPPYCRGWDSALTAATVQGWPLWQASFRPECSGQPMGTYISRSGARAAYRCPTSNDHDNDAKAYLRMIEVSMMWARCAQEALYSTAIRELNRADHAKPKVSVVIDGPYVPPKPQAPSTFDRSVSLGLDRSKPPVAQPHFAEIVGHDPYADPADMSHDQSVPDLSEEPPPGADPDVPEAAAPVSDPDIPEGAIGEDVPQDQGRYDERYADANMKSTVDIKPKGSIIPLAAAAVAALILLR